MKAAAIDIGTNSIKMVIGWRNEQGVVETEERTPVITRLGKGVDKTSDLQAEAMERSLETLRRFATEALGRGVTEIKAVGTSALRDAGNGAEFVRQAEAILRGEVEIISGEREAELVYRSALGDSQQIAPTAGTLITTDIGGGSTEIVIGEGKQIHFRRSLQLGAVRLTERLLVSDPPTAAELAQATETVDTALASVPRPSAAVLIASGGTAANLGALALMRSIGMPVPTREQLISRLHGLTLSREEIEQQVERLAGLPLAERRQVPGLEPDRADVIVAGALIQARLLRHFDLDHMFLSVRGLRYGLLYELL